MAQHAEFEEKEFEGAANAELARAGAVWSSGQVMEQIVGYDAIAAPVARHVIWQVLRVPRPPGVRLLPALWYGQGPSADRLPRMPVSLVLQYKRPQHLYGHTAAQWRYWKQPYFRFRRNESQHRVLRRLDRLLEGKAVVRYASPAFWRFSDLESAVLTLEVLRLTGFVSPMKLGSHRTWTYVRPGIAGKANPSGRQVTFETIGDVVVALQASENEERSPAVISSAPDALRTHLEIVADAAGSREPTLRRQVSIWVQRVQRRDLLLSPDGLRQLEHLATIASVVHGIGAAWWIADAIEPPQL